MTTTAKTCEWEHEVCDSDFGYWHSDWGTPPVHVVRCDEPATTTLTLTEYDPFENRAHKFQVRLCATHATSLSPLFPKEA